MLTHFVLMPISSPTDKTGRVTKWLRREGETVKAGEVIAEIETDKATMEIEADHDGILGEILVPAGLADIPVHAPLSSILREDFEHQRNRLEFACNLLGGASILQRELESTLDVHEFLLRGLPRVALTHLLQNLVSIGHGRALEIAIGIESDVAKNDEHSGPLLGVEQSGRTWIFVDILARATAVFGSQERSEKWLQENAIGLEQRRPIDLLRTPAGIALVEEYLTRMEYGVYA